MDWADTAIVAGLLAIPASIALMVRQVGKRNRESIAQRRARQVEDVSDLAIQAVPFGGIALMQIGSMAQYLIGGTTPSIPWFTVLSGMTSVLIFGFQLGRLFMRWQVRRLLAAPQDSGTALST